MKNNETMVHFRVDRELNEAARERLISRDVKFSDVMRAAVKAIAVGDVTPLADIISEGAQGETDNRAWLFSKCHELFEYRDGDLFRKKRKGAGDVGDVAYLRQTRRGEMVKVDGKLYPVQGIIWLMQHGTIAGRVTFKNPARVAGKYRIENLMLTREDDKDVVFEVLVSDRTAGEVKAMRQRAISVDVHPGDDVSMRRLNDLVDRGRKITLVISSHSGWQVGRTGTHAFRVSDNKFIVSIS